MELRLKVDSSFMNELKKRMNMKSNTELTATALTLLDWASKEKQSGHNIITQSEDGKTSRLVMPQLERVKTEK